MKFIEVLECLVPYSVSSRSTLPSDSRNCSRTLNLQPGTPDPRTHPVQKIRESGTLQFRWDVFNALNLTRFDVQSLSLSLTNESNFGSYTGLLTNPRVMQFSLRFEF